jgi:fused signal recognition particle receptor
MQTETIVILGVVVLAVVLVTLLWVRRRSGPGATPVEANRLSRTAGALGAALRNAWSTGLDSDTWDGIEEALLAADVGVEGTDHIVAAVRDASPSTVEEAKAVLASRMVAELGVADRSLRLDGHPAVVLVVGVNGSGKTTTIAKLAKRFEDEGKTVVLGAADTFRAAAGEQLKTWADRVGVDVVAGEEGGDPASVAYDTLASARAKNADVVIIDTAGRLHGKKNLMAEMQKIHRVSSGDGEVDEVLLVLDATAGQNGLAQVREFADAVPLTGLVLTKLDGTARGGIVIAVEKQLGVPVKLVGLGEGMDDLEPFEPDRFVAALLEDA